MQVLVEGFLVNEDFDFLDELAILIPVQMLNCSPSEDMMYFSPTGR